MKVIYISKARLPTEKAYGTNMVKTCEALAKAGAEVLLVAPRCGNIHAPNDIFSYYAIEKIFKIRFLPIVDFISLGWRGGFWLNHFSFLFLVLFHDFGEKRKCVILSRDELSALCLKMRGYRVFYDMHGFPEKKRWFWKIIMGRMDGIIATNWYKIVQCRDVFGIPEARMMVAPNGFDPALFEIKESKKELRKKLNFPQNARIVMYTGNLYDWKGAYTLLNAVRIVQQEFFVFIGGTGKELEDFKKKAHQRSWEKILILGHKPYYEIPKYLKAADVLVLPNSQFSRDSRFAVYSQHDTSPIKLFEYMASGVPIVASALPSICEILNLTNAVLVRPDNPNLLREGIESILNDPAFGARLAARAAEEVKKYAWDKRGERILTFIKVHL